MRELDLVGAGLWLYAWIYFGGIAAMATWEGLAPRRALVAPLRGRWLANFAVTLLDTLLVRAVWPFLSVGAAVFAAERQIGLFHAVSLPASAAWVLALVALDGSRYLQHFALHRVGWLWRLHRMHHTDADYDFTTALRFHPLEALSTTGLAVCVVLLLGLPAAAVLGYELLSTGVALFAHGNVRVPARLDRALRWLVLTPDLHRVHHSANAREMESNFASVCPWWDRAFGTYRAAPALGHDAMRIGLPEFSEPRHQALSWMLANPWLGAGADPAAIAEAEAGGSR